MHSLRQNRAVPSGLVLLVNLLVAASLLLVAASHRLARALSRGAAALAALPAVTGLLLVVYVFGEDSYRGNGISRWEAYRSPGGALEPMFLSSLVLLLACAGLLVYAGFRRKEWVLRPAALGGGFTALFLVTATIIGFTAN